MNTFNESGAPRSQRRSGCGFADEEVEGGEAGEEDGAFERDGNAVEAGEFGEERAAGGGSLNGAHLNAERGHSGADGELRNYRQNKHKRDT